MAPDPAEPATPTDADVRALLGRRLRRGATGGSVGGPSREDRRIPLRPDPDGPAPLSAAQRRLWFMEQLFPGTAAYNVPTAFRIHGPLDVSVLRRALGEVTRRHQALRSRFDEDADGEPQQRVQPPRLPSLPVVELASARPEADTLALARRMLGDDSRTPFDLASGPLLRAGLLRLNSRDHILLLTFHHIVADHLTLVVVCDELSAAYSAMLRGERHSLPELPLQYADFAVWQRTGGDSGEDSLAYWTGRLAGVAPSALPTDRPRPAVSAFAGARVSTALPPATVEGLRAAAGANGASLFMAVLAGLQALLHLWTGDPDVTVGGAMAGRDLPELEQLAGFFVDILPLRTDLSGDPSFAELLGRARETVLSAADHRGLPFDRLVQAVAPTRDLSRPPLFSACLSYLSSPPPRLELAGATVSEFRFDPGTVRFDLDLFAEQRADGTLLLELDYRTDLFEAATAERLLDRLAALLTAAALGPQSRLSALTAPGPADTAELLALETRPVSHPTGPLVHELVARHTASAPDRPAVVDGDRIVSYRELDGRAEALAARLRRSGVGPGTLVGVCLRRSPELVAALLAVWKAGGAYLPLDPEYPPDRLAHMLADSAAPLVLVDARTAGTVPGRDARQLRIDAPDTDGAAVPPHPDVPAAATAGDLAYAIYTSGSTGRPKGVLIEHRALLSLCHWHNRRHQVSPADRGTMLAAQGFDAAVWELWPYLAAGASVSVVDPAARTEPDRLIRWLKQTRATVTFLPTPLAEAVLAEDGCVDLPLRSLLTGGELLRRRPRPGLPFSVVNHYGPTECAVVATEGEVADSESAEGPADIGSPIDHVEARVLGPGLERVPRGVVGELYLGGSGLARGYLGAEELTRQRFVPDPEGAPGARLYRTGDLVRWRNDGRLEFLGRADRQIKLRGHRIEPGEIEAGLVEHPQVSEAVVVLHAPAGTEPSLVAYLTLRGGTAEREPEGLRGWLADRLPEPMLPSRFLVVPEIPLTPAGKLDRGRLPDPGAVPVSGRAPRTGTEQRLAALWAEVFARAEVGADDDFFALGGHSLLATRLVGRIRRDFGIEVPLHSLFRSPTVALLASDVVEPALAAAQAETTRRLREHMSALSVQELRALVARGATTSPEES